MLLELPAAADLTKVTVVETLWPLLMLLSVLVAADGRRWQTDLTAKAAEVTEVSVVPVVETLWPLPMLQSVSVAADGWRWQSERPA